MAVSSGKPVGIMSPMEKIGEAIRLSLPLLPLDVRQTVLTMLSPTSLALMGATLTVWMGSHFFGVGEIVDGILLGVGAVTLGFSVFSGAREFHDFTNTALKARSEQDLQVAARHFSQAVIILGISTVQGLLMKGPARRAVTRGLPRAQPTIPVGRPPTTLGLQVERLAKLPRGALGRTYEYGEIELSRDQPLSEQRATLLHELVHRYFSPRTGPLQKVRAELRSGAYDRYALIAYLEEALAEGYMQLRMNGLAEALKTYRFPVDRGYVTVSQMIGEGQAFGTVAFGGMFFYVSVSPGHLK